MVEVCLRATGSQQADLSAFLCPQTASIIILYPGSCRTRGGGSTHPSCDSQTSNKAIRSLDKSRSAASYPVIKNRFLFNNVSKCGFVSRRPGVLDILDWSYR